MVEKIILSLMMFNSPTLPDVRKTFEFKNKEECSYTLNMIKLKYIDEYAQFSGTCYKEIMKKG
jgi:hypothetical protein